MHGWGENFQQINIAGLEIWPSTSFNLEEFHYGRYRIDFLSWCVCIYLQLSEGKRNNNNNNKYLDRYGPLLKNVEETNMEVLEPLGFDFVYHRQHYYSATPPPQQ